MTKKFDKILVMLLILCVSVTGCTRKAKREAAQKKLAKQPLIDVVDSVDLAKLLLKPDRPLLRIKRDPFAPLHAKIPEEGEDPIVFEQNIEELLQNIKYHGYVKVNQEYSALLIVNREKGVFNINDKVEELRISDINQEYIVLTNGTRTYKLQRGEK